MHICLYISHSTEMGLSLYLKLPWQTASSGPPHPSPPQRRGYRHEGGCRCVCVSFDEGAESLMLTQQQKHSYLLTHEAISPAPAHGNPLSAPQIFRQPPWVWDSRVKTGVEPGARTCGSGRGLTKIIGEPLAILSRYDPLVLQVTLVPHEDDLGVVPGIGFDLRSPVEL